MSLLIDITIRSSIVLAAALIAVLFLHRRSAALRHAVLAGAILMAALVVPLSWTMPEWRVSVPAFVTTQRVAPHTAVYVGSAAGLSQAVVNPTTEPSLLQPVAISLWGTGVIVSLSGLVLAFARLRRVASRAVPVAEGAWTRTAQDVGARFGVRRPIALLQSSSPDLLATWGAARPRVLLPAQASEWTDARIHAVLCHEVAHIQRHDWLVQVAAEIVRAFQWFNPLFWVACRRLRQYSELACDDGALRLGVSPHDYALHLLEIARICRPSSMPVAAVVPMARASTLERRIAAMLNARIDRQALSGRAVALIFVCLVGIAIPTAAVRAAQGDPRPLTGTVYDPTGAVMPEAALTLEDAQHHTWHATSDAEGHFALDQIAPGHYVLTVTLPGFKSLHEETELRAARDWDRAITMQVGDVQETITVEQTRDGTSMPASTGPVRLRVGGNIRPPRKVHHQQAVYPESMIAAGIEGKVLLEATISGDGAVHTVRVLTAQVHPDLAVAAADAVRQWKFEPTLLNGRPVEVVMKVTVDFRLKD